MVTPHSLDAPYRLYPAAHPVLSSLLKLQLPLAIESMLSELKMVLYLGSLKDPFHELRGSCGLTSSDASAYYYLKTLVFGSSRVDSLVRPTTDPEHSPYLTIHALQQQYREEPMAQIVGCEGRVQPIFSPRLLLKLLIAGIEDDSVDARD